MKNGHWPVGLELTIPHLAEGPVADPRIEGRAGAGDLFVNLLFPV